MHSLEEQPCAEDAAVVDGEVGGVAAEAEVAVSDEAAFEEEGPDTGGGAGAEQNAIVAVFAADADARAVDIDLVAVDVVFAGGIKPSVGAAEAAEVIARAGAREHRADFPAVVG